VGRLATLNTQLSAFLRRHPLLRDALVWAIPALIIGAVLRGMLLSYLPYAYWGSDSRSYYGFTEQLLDTGKISLYDKRRYLYLIGMLPVTLLPGSICSLSGSASGAVTNSESYQFTDTSGSRTPFTSSRAT